MSIIDTEIPNKGQTFYYLFHMELRGKKWDSSSSFV